MKNSLVRLLALILLIIVLPGLLFVCVFILIFERKTPFFTQERLGLNKQSFTIFKFRTFKDGKISTIGKVLRKTGIDELPQLINIIKGELNFIGPRPLTQSDIERLNWDNSFYNSRWNVKPGLTGLAQLSPICHKKMTFFWDSYYAKNQSFLLNLNIFLASMATLIIGKKRVKSIISKKLKRK